MIICGIVFHLKGTLNPSVNFRLNKQII